MYGHDYINGHKCPSCGKSGIPCTIEDGFCENEGDCDDCIKERFIRQESDGYDDSSSCKHGFFEGEDCPICEHIDGQHETEESEVTELCPMCNGSTEQEANEMYRSNNDYSY